MKVLVTGGAGFIGGAVIRHLINDLDFQVLNLDKLTYAGNLESLREFENNPNYRFEKIDICDAESVRKILMNFQPDRLMHLAAESHVDRSIDGAAEFIHTNVVGTYVLLEESRKYCASIENGSFLFHHVSTDEVYGDLEGGGYLFTEDTPYAPSSPYSASKASSDHFVRAWNRTYGFPVVITNCSNNYGPYQFPEKLIPLMILNALKGKPLPVYGNGQQIRDWLYVEDHAKALVKVMLEGKIGDTYNIGGHNEKTNLEVVNVICELMDELVPEHPAEISSYKELITFVEDRPGHDIRYAIDATKIERELGWLPFETFESGIRKTVEWYLANGEWCEQVQSENYNGERIGVSA